MVAAQVTLKPSARPKVKLRDSHAVPSSIGDFGKRNPKNTLSGGSRPIRLRLFQSPSGETVLKAQASDNVVSLVVSVPFRGNGLERLGDVDMSGADTYVFQSPSGETVLKE